MSSSWNVVLNKEIKTDESYQRLIQIDNSDAQNIFRIILTSEVSESSDIMQLFMLVRSDRYDAFKAQYAERLNSTFGSAVFFNDEYKCIVLRSSIAESHLLTKPVFDLLMDTETSFTKESVAMVCLVLDITTPYEDITTVRTTARPVIMWKAASPLQLSAMSTSYTHCATLIVTAITDILVTFNEINRKLNINGMGIFNNIHTSANASLAPWSTANSLLTPGYLIKCFKSRTLAELSVNQYSAPVSGVLVSSKFHHPRSARRAVDLSSIPELKEPLHYSVIPAHEQLVRLRLYIFNRFQSLQASQQAAAQSTETKPTQAQDGVVAVRRR